MNIDINYFRKKLEEEKEKIEEELGSIGLRNPKNSSDWQAVYPEKEQEEKIEADPLDVADNIEDYQERFALTDVLEKRLNNVKSALVVLEKGTYGICKIGGKDHPIEHERLDANPAATTCINHMEE